MFRIDTSRAVPDRPDAAAAGTPGYFTGGNPATGFLPTQFSPDWCNDIQESLMAVLADAGITATKGPDGDGNLRDAIRAMIAGKTRLRLTANLDLYVATTGNDANPGTVDASFRNIQTAINYVYRALDLAGYSVTIHVAPGTYTEALYLWGLPFGSGPYPLCLTGDTTTPANVHITTSNATQNVVQAVGGAGIRIEGFKLSHTTATASAASLIWSAGGAVVWIKSIECGVAPAQHLYALKGGEIATLASDWTRADAAPYKISGGTRIHALSTTGGVVMASHSTITLTGTPNFSTAFVKAYMGGGIWFDGCTFSGTATGQRYSIDSFGWVLTAGGGANFLPGNIAGAVDTLGKYT